MAKKSLGKHFIVGLSGPELSSREAKQLKELDPLGIILFGYNFSKSDNWRKVLGKLVCDVQDCLGTSKIIFSIDHEGDKVHRFLNQDVTRFPPAYCWKEQAKNVGLEMGRELFELGINLNFAPVLDVYTEKENPVIGCRSLSGNVEEIVQYAGLFVSALHSQGVLACSKHFPGHGRTTTDSHLELPVVEASKVMLEEVDIAPFRKLIGSELSCPRLIMTSHVLYPNLDPKLPATLSEKILTRLLKQDLGFEGVIISDALEMKALNSARKLADVKLAFSAGLDVALLAQADVSSSLEEALEICGVLEGDIELMDLLKPSKARIESVLDFMEHLKMKREPLARSESSLLSQLENRWKMTDIN